MKNAIIILLLMLPLWSGAQTGPMLISTAAGSDTATSAGDGRMATNAKLFEPEGIWVDGSCNIYVADRGNARIRQIDGTTHRIATIAGTGVRGYSGDGGPATNAKVDKPLGLYADAAGNVYFAESDSNRIRRIDKASGIIKTFAGGGTSTAEGVQATAAKITQPQNVYGDRSGNIYIAEYAKVRKVDATGKITTVAGTGSYGLPVDNVPATSTALGATVIGLAIDDSDNLFIADYAVSRIRRVSSTTGIITTFAGTNNGFYGDHRQATGCQLSTPTGIFFDRSGNLLIADYGNERLRMVEMATGVITTVAGNGIFGNAADGSSATASPINPNYIYIDLDGNIYYSDFSYGKIRTITNYTGGAYISGSNCSSPLDVANTAHPGNAITISPNPTAGPLNISSGVKITDVAIASLAGEVVYSHTWNVSDIQLNISRLPPGMYLLHLVDENGERVVRKVVKE